jgi:UDP-glucose 4-epimerase
MKIGITGGAGFIGSNLAEVLIKSGHQVYVFDNLETGFLENINHLSLEFIKGDLRNYNEVENFFKKSEIEYCVHLGALGSVPRSILNPRASFESNALATLNVLESAKLTLIPVMYSSSSSVYGSNLKLPKTEKDWLAPISPYAASKLAAESLTTAFGKSYGLPVITYRLFNVYGPIQNPESMYSAVIPKWILAAFKKEPLIIFGDGEQKRDFTFINDVTDIFKKSIEESLVSNDPINLAFGKSVTLNDILKVFKMYFGEIDLDYRDIRQGDIINSESNPELLVNLHKGDLSQTSISDGLLRTFEWYKSRYNF